MALNVKGSNNKTYRISVDSTTGVVSCTCPSWRFMDAPIAHRACKHIRTLEEIMSMQVAHADAHSGRLARV